MHQNVAAVLFIQSIKDLLYQNFAKILHGNIKRNEISGNKEPVSNCGSGEWSPFKNLKFLNYNGLKRMIVTAIAL